MPQQARVLVAVAAEADDKSIWSRLKMLPELFAAGPVAIRVGFFGAEGARSSRPFTVSRWTTDPVDLADLLEKARIRCICGCFIKSAAFSSRHYGRRSKGRCELWSSLATVFTANSTPPSLLPGNCARLEPGYSYSSKAILI